MFLCRPPQLLPQLRVPLNKRFKSSYRTVKEFDVLLLRQRGRKFAKWHLTEPIERDSRIKLSYSASIAASDLIGKQLLERIEDSKGNTVVIHQPTLASYIVNSPRQATPVRATNQTQHISSSTANMQTKIYPADAETIVSLLDLHVTRPGEADEEDDAPFEVFEAGTGMCSLSLHIARALHAANPPVPASLRAALRSAPLARNVATSPGGVLNLTPKQAEQLSAYRASRRAILHTLDHNGGRTRAAYKLVRGFRGAQYLADMEFHVGAVNEYVESRLAASGGAPVFSRAVLDLPAAQQHAQPLIRALHPDSLLVIFAPSISQIAEFQMWAMEGRMPVQLEKVLELPTTTGADAVRDGGSGGKHWDVRIIRPKPAPVEAKGEGGEPAAVVEPDPVLVLRPKVGGRVAGGGFVAVFRKWPSEAAGAEETEDAEVEEREGAEA